MNLGLVWRAAVLEFNSDGICSDSEQSLGSRADGSLETWAFFQMNDYLSYLSWPFNVVLLWAWVEPRKYGLKEPGGNCGRGHDVGKEIPLWLGESCQQTALSSAVGLLRGLVQLKRATFCTVAEVAYKHLVEIEGPILPALPQDNFESSPQLQNPPPPTPATP